MCCLTAGSANAESRQYPLSGHSSITGTAGGDKFQSWSHRPCKVGLKTLTEMLLCPVPSKASCCSIAEIYCRATWQGLLVLEMLMGWAEQQDVQDYKVLYNQRRNWIQSLRSFREGIS